MTGRDRTQEFLSAVKSLQSRQSHVATVHQARRPPPTPDAFGNIAKQIGFDLSQTCAKLQKLTLLAKQCTIFDDHAVEIQELTKIVKEDINALNKQIWQLRQLAQSIRKTKDVSSHKNSVVLSLQSRLATMSSSFQSVLEVRTENMKKQKKKRDQYSQDTVTRSLPSSIGQGGSALMRATSPRNRNGEVSIPMDSLSEQALVGNDQSDAYAEQRASAVSQIESTIVELGQIFNQLATMIKDQEEQVMRIDQNVDETVANVEAGYGELLKYFKGITSNRWLMVKIFLVVLVFFIIFVVFMT